MEHWWKKINEDVEKRLAKKNIEAIKDAFDIVMASGKMYIMCGSHAVKVISVNQTAGDIINEIEDMIHVAIEYENSNIKN